MLERKVKWIYLRYQVKKYVWLYAQLLGCVIIIVFGVYNNKTVEETVIQQGIAKEIIRFHVLANSDTKEDQNLKLKVKSEVVKYLQTKLSGVDGIDEARQVILQEESNIQTIAEKVIKENNYNYTVKVLLENYYFPAKTYGEFTFPPGEYEALRVLIGEAKGKNWWCVMFPTLCMVDESYNVVPDKSKVILQDTLTEKEYNSINQNSRAVNNKIDNKETESSGKNNESGQLDDCKKESLEKKEVKVELKLGIWEWICSWF